MLMRPAPDAIIHSAKECDTDGSTPRWILADFDDTLAPGDSHAGLLRYILRRRIWPLLLLPVIALGGLVYLVPSQRRRGISLIWWAISLGLSPLGWRKLVRAYCRLGDLRQPLRAGASPALSATARPVAPPDHWLADALPFWWPDAALLLPRTAQAAARDLRPRCRAGLERQPARSATAGVGGRGMVDQSDAHAIAKGPGLLAPSDAQKLATVRQS